MNKSLMSLAAICGLLVPVACAVAPSKSNAGPGQAASGRTLYWSALHRLASQSHVRIRERARYISRGVAQYDVRATPPHTVRYFAVIDHPEAAGGQFVQISGVRCDTTYGTPACFRWPPPNLAQYANELLSPDILYPQPRGPKCFYTRQCIRFGITVFPLQHLVFHLGHPQTSMVREVVIKARGYPWYCDPELPCGTASSDTFLHYTGILTVDGATGLPLLYKGWANVGVHREGGQTVTFRYGGHFSIRLPKHK